HEVAQKLGRQHHDLDAVIEYEVGGSIPEFFRERGEAAFRKVEEDETLFALDGDELCVFALGGGAVTSLAVQERLRERALTVWIDVDLDTCWERARGSDRPLAQDESEFRRLYDERRPLYQRVADARAGDATEVILAAGGISPG